jgi:hypothetical protein
VLFNLPAERLLVTDCIQKAVGDELGFEFLPLAKLDETVFNHADSEGKYWNSHVVFDLCKSISKPYATAMAKLPWEWARVSMLATLPYLNKKLKKLKDQPLQLLVEEATGSKAIKRFVPGSKLGTSVAIPSRIVRGVSSPGSVVAFPSTVLRYLADIQDVRFQMLLEGDSEDLQIHLKRFGAKRGFSVRLKKRESWQVRKTALYSCGAQPAPPPARAAHNVSTWKHRSQFLFFIKCSLTRS